jgi:D-3-phosphoglycerate dehydrogenase
MPKILLTNHYTPEVLEVVKSVLPDGFEVIALNEPGSKEIISKAKEADYILVGGRTKIDRSILDAAPQLKMIQRSGVGLDSLDLDAIKERGLSVYVNPGVNARSVAEHTVMLLLASLKNLARVHNTIASGVWKKHELGIHNHELYGKTVGLIGLGHIGKHVAQMLKPFGAEVIYNKRSPLSTEEESNLGVRYVELDDLLRSSHIISLHCSLNKDTRSILNADAIAMMKNGVVLVNTSRGKLIDEGALIEKLRTGKIAAAGLDVYDTEPISESNPLLKMENVILTPHISGITYESFISMMQEAFSNMDAYEKGLLDSIEHKKLTLS